MNDFWIILIAVAVFSPLPFLSPKVKRFYLPVALCTLALGMQLQIFLIFGKGPFFYLMLFMGFSGLIFVLPQLRVCESCGKIIGNVQGAGEVHRCTSPNTFNPQDLRMPRPIQHDRYVKVALACMEEVKTQFDSTAGNVIVSDGMRNNKRLVGICFLIFFLGFGYYSLSHSFQDWGVILAFLILSIFLLVHSSQSEINGTLRTITRKHLLFGKFTIWKRTYVVANGDYLEVRLTPLEKGQYFHNMVISQGGRKRTTIVQFLRKGSETSPVLFRFAEATADVLQIPYLSHKLEA